MLVQRKNEHKIINKILLKTAIYKNKVNSIYPYRDYCLISTHINYIKSISKSIRFQYYAALYENLLYTLTTASENIRLSKGKSRPPYYTKAAVSDSQVFLQLLLCNNLSCRVII